MRKIFLFSFLAILSSCAQRPLESRTSPPQAERSVTESADQPEEKPAVEPAQKLIAGTYVVKSTQRGKMSWYSVKTNGGTATASGKRFTNAGATAAHRTLPFGTKVRVTNLTNNRTQIVTITDRGPFIKGRIIDVSIGTARKLKFVNAGVVSCKVEVLAKP